MSFEDYEDLVGEETYDYVEDTFMEADDLAEHAIPSPPHMNEDEDFDVDLWQYDYWNDIDYGSDGDEIRQRQLDSRTTRKRKLLATTGKVSPSKRRKVLQVKKRPTGKAQSMDELPTVVMMKRAVDQRYEAQEVKTVDVKPLVPVGLLGDWREKFRNTPMFAKQRSSVQLREVHDAPDDDGSQELEEMDDVKAMVQGQVHTGDLDEEWEDEDEEGDGEDGPLDLDPEALKMAIQQNLAAAGINIKGLDEQTIMAMAMKMFSGGGESDDLIGEMADQLLGGRKGDAQDNDEEQDAATEDEEGGFAGWVQKQAEAKAATREHDLPTPTDSSGKPSASPPDKRPPKGPQHDEDIEEQAAEVGAERQRGTKRKADSAAEVVQPKRAARRFDAPTAASKARSASGKAPASASATTKRKGRKG